MHLAIIGLAIIVAAVAVWFIRVDDVAYMKWRLFFIYGETLALSIALMLIVLTW